MKTLLRGALLLSLLSLGAPAASADDREVTWRCGWASVNTFSQEGPDAYLFAAAVTTADATGTFYCEVRRDGWPTAWTSYLRSEHVFAGAAHAFGWQLEPPEGLEVCAHIDWDDGHAPFDECRPASNEPLDPSLFDPVLAVVDPLYDFVNSTVFGPTDPITCAVLATQAPGVPALVDVDPTGDTSALGVPLWDCPPYAT